MLGYVTTSGRGAADRLLAEAAGRLMAEGVALAGAVQFNAERGPGLPCDMDLHVLADGRTLRISQNLGPLARGCRLDPAGLEQAVGLVEAALSAAPGPRLLVVNKFGQQEVDGRGFRPVIGRALAEGIPVLTAVSQANRAAFESFAEGLGEPVPAELAAILDWCRRATA